MNDKPSVSGILFFMKIIKGQINVGDVYGRLTVNEIETVSYAKGKFKILVHVICSCGKKMQINRGQFGNKKSCGCLQKEIRHNKCRTDIYQIWNTIKTRCYCKSSKQYADYGGRGIFMCEGNKIFLNFEKNIGKRPSKKHSIDRINNDHHYCCGECSECILNKWDKNIRWATPTQQSYNKRNNRYIIYNGEKLCLTQVAIKCGISQSVLSQRIDKLKWSIEEATTIPVNRKSKYIHKGRIGRNQYSK